ncbi:hypothetical protein CEXT_353801 [Caerostris extrusa]|uniref:Uncharacterized protein n=1 Tax=Caerostris extrusa TaxID=172846 RepID=A0AAV4X4V6_CAEEX|nr:hypothetical protein CEXT_353801 [Caerostris extrusa]
MVKLGVFKNTQMEDPCSSIHKLPDLMTATVPSDFLKGMEELCCSKTRLTLQVHPSLHDQESQHDLGSIGEQFS